MVRAGPLNSQQSTVNSQQSPDGATGIDITREVTAAARELDVVLDKS